MLHSGGDGPEDRWLAENEAESRPDEGRFIAYSSPLK